MISPVRAARLGRDVAAVSAIGLRDLLGDGSATLLFATADLRFLGGMVRMLRESQLLDVGQRQVGTKCDGI
jgi:hypothetical protein